MTRRQTITRNEAGDLVLDTIDTTSVIMPAADARKNLISLYSQARTLQAQYRTTYDRFDIVRSSIQAMEALGVSREDSADPDSSDDETLMLGKHMDRDI